MWKRNKSRRDTIVLIKMANNTRNIEEKRGDFKIFINTRKKWTWHNVLETAKRNLLPSADLRYVLLSATWNIRSPFLSYDHSEITTAAMRRKLQSARPSFMADSRHLVTLRRHHRRRRRRRRRPNFCNASCRSPLSFLRPLNLSIRRQFDYRAWNSLDSIWKLKAGRCGRRVASS